LVVTPLVSLHHDPEIVTLENMYCNELIKVLILAYLKRLHGGCNMALWLFRAGTKGEYEQAFLNENCVYITWPGLAHDLSKLLRQRELYDLLLETYPNKKPSVIRNWTGQVWSAVRVMSKGDYVVLPSKLRPANMHIGQIAGQYSFDPRAKDRFYHYRPVNWIAKDIPRSSLTPSLKRYLSARQTICRLREKDLEVTIREIGEIYRASERDEASGLLTLLTHITE
jgi:restriction system protein